MSEAQTPDNENSLTRAESARLFVAGVLSMMMTLVFNGTLYLAYDGIFDWSREVSTATSIALAIACLAIARKRPALICPRTLTVCTIGLSIAGYALCAVGVALNCAPAIVAGVMAVAPHRPVGHHLVAAVPRTSAAPAGMPLHGNIGPDGHRAGVCGKRMGALWTGEPHRSHLERHHRRSLPAPHSRLLQAIAPG